MFNRHAKAPKYADFRKMLDKEAKPLARYPVNTDEVVDAGPAFLTQWAMQQVVEATGATFGGTLYVDSLSEADGPVPTYLELLRHDVDLIIAGLSGTEA